MTDAGARAFDGFLERAITNRWCHRPGCSTCGGQPFYKELEHLAASLGPNSEGPSILAREVGRLNSGDPADLLADVLVWIAKGVGSDSLSSALGPGPASRLFSRMLAAHAAGSERRAAHAARNDPEFVSRERARKKTERALAHEERLALKAQRDAARRGEQ